MASLALRNDGSSLLVGRREAKTREAILKLRSRGEVSGWTVDITSGTERATLIDHLNAEHNYATSLVNAAGVFAPKPFLEHTEADYDRYLEINRALFFLTPCVAKNILTFSYRTENARRSQT